jgi:predicted transcriptional regulator
MSLLSSILRVKEGDFVSGNVLLLSIHPEYAEKIFNGTKEVELRRICPRRINKGDSVLVYVSSPLKALVGGFEVDEIIEALPEMLWENVKHKAGISRSQFDDYYSGTSLAYGIFLRDTWKLEQPITLDTLRDRWPNFKPPQGYHYISNDDVSLLTGSCGI